MADQDLLNAFNDCLDRLAAGQDLDHCLRHYPNYAAALLPMLETSRVLSMIQIPPVEVSLAQERSRIRFEQAIRLSKPRPQYSLLRFANLAVAVVMIFVLVCAGATLVAQSTLPGDPLYDLKLLSEQISLSIDPSLNGLFNQRRIAEVKTLLAQGRSEEVAFTGQVTAMSATTWNIGGLSTRVLPDTPGAVNAHIGDVVKVQAQTAPQNELIATQITLVTPAQPTPTQPPTPVSTVIPLTPTYVVPTITPSPMLTDTVSPSPTITPAPTSTPPALFVPSSTPSPSPTLCLSTPPRSWVIYYVQQGDRLSTLASSHSTSLQLLMSVNCLVDPNILVLDQKLYLPGSSELVLTETPEQSGSSGPDNGNISPTDTSSGSSGSDNSSSEDSGDDHGGSDNSGHGSGS